MELKNRRKTWSFEVHLYIGRSSHYQNENSCQPDTWKFIFAMRSVWLALLWKRESSPLRLVWFLMQIFRQFLLTIEQFLTMTQLIIILFYLNHIIKSSICDIFNHTMYEYMTVKSEMPFDKVSAKHHCWWMTRGWHDFCQVRLISLTSKLSSSFKRKSCRTVHAITWVVAVVGA